MRTARGSSRPEGGLHQASPGSSPPPWTRHTPLADPPGPDTASPGPGTHTAPSCE